MSDILRIDAEDAEVIAEAKDAAAEYANAKSYPDVMSAQERLRSMGAGAIPALLAENKRLQDNYDTALGACVEARKEILALREALTLTPEKVEAAAEAAYNQFFDVGDWQDSPQNAEHACWRGVGSAALLAAGMEAQP